MSEHDFSAVTAVERVGETTFAVRFPTGWEQGRGVFGGAVVGAMARAAIAMEPDAERAVRQVAAEIVAPVPPGACILDVRVLRRGNGLTALDVLLRAEAQTEISARASFTLAKARSYDRSLTAVAAPVMPAVDAVPIAPMGPPFAPVFTQHVRFRSTGPAPFSGGGEPRVEGWTELKEASSWGPAEWLGLVDTYWPTFFSLESAPRPAVTVGFTCHLFSAPPRGPLYLRARASRIEGGFLSETRELWTPDGHLVALNPQLFAVV